MQLPEITEQFRKQAEKAASIGKTLKFQLDEGPVFIDLTGETPQVTNEDKEADCTIKTSLATIEKLRNGDLNPMTAMMTGKLKISGDMSVALKLQSLLS